MWKTLIFHALVLLVNVLFYGVDPILIHYCLKMEYEAFVGTILGWVVMSLINTIISKSPFSYKYIFDLWLLRRMRTFVFIMACFHTMIYIPYQDAAMNAKSLPDGIGNRPFFHIPYAGHPVELQFAVEIVKLYEPLEPLFVIILTTVFRLKPKTPEAPRKPEILLRRV